MKIQIQTSIAQVFRFQDEIEQIRNDVEIIKTGEVEKMKKQLEESQRDAGHGIRVPIGGIKIPGFLRSRSRDKNKVQKCLPEDFKICFFI